MRQQDKQFSGARVIETNGRDAVVAAAVCWPSNCPGHCILEKDEDTRANTSRLTNFAKIYCP